MIQLNLHLENSKKKLRRTDNIETNTRCPCKCRGGEGAKDEDDQQDAKSGEIEWNLISRRNMKYCILEHLSH